MRVAAIAVVLLIFYSGSVQAETCPVRSSDLEVYPQEDQNDEAITPLYFGLMVSSSEALVVTAVQSALDSVNSNSSILNGYSLHYTLTFSECSGSDLVDKTLTQLSEDKLGLIEAGCTDTRANFGRAYLVNNFNIPQITCSPTIRDGSTQLNIFKMSPSLDDVIVPALERVITHYNWSRVALMAENKQKYIEELNNTATIVEYVVISNFTFNVCVHHLQMVEAMRGSNITLSVTKLSMENDTLKHDDICGKSLFDSTSRIFVLIMSSEMVNHVLCEAHKQGMKYPKYEFIFAGELNSTLSSANWENGCSSQQRAEVLNHSLAFEWRPISTEQNHSLGLDQTDFTDKRAFYCYDGVWALALALNKTMTPDCTNRCNCSLKSDNLTQKLQQTDFIGKTGIVKFGANGARSANKVEVLVLQYQFSDNLTSDGMDAVQIGSYRDDEFTLIDNMISWPEGVPYDGSPVDEIVTVSIPLAITFSLIATGGIILSILCCIFNFAYRNAKVVQLTSPNLNYFIISGTICAFISVYWYTLPSTNPKAILSTCCLQLWFLGIGIFLVLGTITAKLWRIYYIFKNPDSSRKSAITDCHLLAFIFSMVAIVVVILLTYTAIEVGIPGYELNKVSSEDHHSSVVGPLSVETHYQFYTCSRVPYSRTILTGLMFLIIAILLISDLFMAFKTRKIRIKGLNDAKYITAIVYCCSFDFLIHLIINFTLRSHVNIFPAVLTGLLILLTTVVLGLVFLPKMINLYQDPNGDHIFINEDQPVVQLSTLFANDVQVNVEGNKLCQRCQKLQTRIRHLQQQLQQTNENDSVEVKSSPIVHSTNPTFCEIESEGEEHPPPGSHYISQEDMPSDDCEQMVEVSWEADGSTFHIGHRV